MNCGDFRYLIQRRFDVELSSSDDRALLIHLETCDSCQKFYHQVQQVIVAAEEMSIPEDLLPPQSELLSDRIFQSIPHSQAGIFTIFIGLFSRFIKPSRKNNGTGGGGLLPEPANSDRLKHLSSARAGGWSEKPEANSDQGAFAGAMPEPEGSPEGRVVGTWGAWSTNQFPDSKTPPLADLVSRPGDAASEGTEADLAEPITRSLGEKFSRFVVSQSTDIGTPANSQPLNLAESIKRRIAEMPKSALTDTVARTGTDDTKTEGGPQDTDSYCDADTFGQWGIPNSPDWPKINSALDLEKSNPNTAPQSWGKAEGSWGNQAAGPVAQPTSPVPDNQIRGGWIQLGEPEVQQESLPVEVAALGENAFAQAVPEPAVAAQSVSEQAAAMPDDAQSDNTAAGGDQLEQILSQQSLHWSHQAEQLETGAWQSVDFDSQQLGAAKSQNAAILQDFINQALAATSAVPLSEPVVSAANEPSIESPNIAAAGVSAEPLVQTTAAPAATPQATAPENTLASRSHLDLAARLQNAIQASASGPKISPVVSKWARDPKARSSFPALDAVQPAKQPDTPPVSQSIPSPVINQPPAINQTVMLPPPVNRSVPPPVNQAIPSSVNRLAAQPASETVKVPTPPTRTFPPARPAVPERTGAQPEKLPAQPARPVVPPLAPVAQPSVPIAQPSVPAAQSKGHETTSQDTDNSRLFNLDDPAIDKLFSENLGIHERASAVSAAPAIAATPVVPAIPAPLSKPVTETSVKASSAPVNVESAGNANQASHLFAIDDQAIDQIFSTHLGVPRQQDSMPITSAEDQPQNDPVKSALYDNPISTTTSSSFDPIVAPISAFTPIDSMPNPSPTIAPAPTPSSVPNNPPPEVSAEVQPISKQKIAGIDRLDGRAEPTPETGSGRIAAIGKFLLDNKDLEKIGKITASDLSERGMRTLSVEAHKELSNLLKQIDSQVGVIGTMIVGHDGLLIANTVPQELEAESLSKWAQAIYMGTTQTLDKLGSERVRQIVSQTERGYLIIANFGAGLLISLTNPLMIDYLLPLMRTITQLVAS